MSGATVLAAATAVLAAIYAAVPDAAKDIAKEEFYRIAIGERSEFEQAAMAAAFEKIGIEIEGDESLTPEFITRCINEGPLAGSDIQLTNIFDKTALKSDLERIALIYARDALGGDLKSMRSDDIKEYARAFMYKKIREQLTWGGDLVEMAPDFVQLAKMLDAAIAAGRMDSSGRYIPPDLKMTPAAISNRERQARYRAGHKRHWELK